MNQLANQTVETLESTPAMNIGGHVQQPVDNTDIHDPVEFLSHLMVQRSTWENAAYKTSNESLYHILGDCLRLYYFVADTTSDERKKARLNLREQMDKIAKERGMRFSADTHMVTKIIRCVFDTDRKRASTYSIVVRAAISNKIAADNLSSFVGREGGIENIRLKKRDPDGSKARKAKEAVRAKLAISHNVGELNVTNPQLIGATAKKGDYNVALIDWQADGKFIVKWIGQSEAAVGSALAAFDRAQKDSKPVAQNDGDVLESMPANDPSVLEEAA